MLCYARQEESWNLIARQKMKFILNFICAFKYFVDFFLSFATDKITGKYQIEENFAGF